MAECELLEVELVKFIGVIARVLYGPPPLQEIAECLQQRLESINI